MRISFLPFGDRSQASARLRVFAIADVLAKLGHHVSIGRDSSSELVVIQKSRDFLAMQEGRQSGARVVYDFDDHFLLHDNGKRDEVLRAIHLADVVTVGSTELYKACRRYHPNVRLFENPIDILDEATVKSDYIWGHRVGWFGNRANLTSLSGIALSHPVRTITENGDIEWSVDTVDEHLRGMDVVVIPVDPTTWNLAKNANRLFKAVALGVPFLASDTPEHVRAIELLELPSWFLVKQDENWDAALQRLQSRYEEMPAILVPAADRARKLFGAEVQAAMWLQAVTSPAESGLDVPDAWQNFARTVDVIVLGERSPERVDETITSIERTTLGFLSVTAVTPIPSQAAKNETFVDDFFDIYSILADRAEHCVGDHVLFLQAGVAFQPAAIEALEAVANTDTLVVLRPQLGLSPVIAETGRELEIARTLPDIVRERPCPHAMLVAKSVLRKHPLDPRCGGLWAWDVLLSAINDGSSLVAVDAATVLVAPETDEATPVDGYVTFVRATNSAAIDDLPPCAQEWQRLQQVLARHIGNRHKALFTTWLPLLITQHQTTAKKRKSKLNEDQQAAKMNLADRTKQFLKEKNAINKSQRQLAAQTRLVKQSSKEAVRLQRMLTTIEGEVGRIATAFDTLRQQAKDIMKEIEGLDDSQWSPEKKAKTLVRLQEIRTLAKNTRKLTHQVQRSLSNESAQPEGDGEKHDKADPRSGSGRLWAQLTFDDALTFLMDPASRQAMTYDEIGQRFVEESTRTAFPLVDGVPWLMSEDAEVLSALPPQVSCSAPDRSTAPELLVLDVGTKTGKGIQRFREQHWEQLGLDPAASAAAVGIDLLQSKLVDARERGIFAIKADATKLPFRDKTYDVTVISELLEHVPRDLAVQVMREALRVTRGIIFIQNPDFTSEDYLRANGLKFTWMDWKVHPHHITRDGMNSILKEAGFSSFNVEQVFPVLDSDHRELIPLEAPPDTLVFDPTLHTKQHMAFSEPVFLKLRVVLDVRVHACERAHSTV